jgi:hypothetical protein
MKRGDTAQRTDAGAEWGLTGGRTINCYAVPKNRAST